MATLNSSTPRTWASSETVTAAQFNEELSSNFNATVAFVGAANLTDTSNATIFANLPASAGSTHHKHVRVTGQVRSEGASPTALMMQFNGITSTTYSWSTLQGIATVSTGGQGTSTTRWRIGAAPVIAGAFGSFDIVVTNPHSTNWKSWVGEASWLTSTTSTGFITEVNGGVLQSTISTVSALAFFLADGSKFSSGTFYSIYWIP